MRPRFSKANEFQVARSNLHPVSASDGLAKLLLSPGLTIDDIPAVRRLVIDLRGLTAAQELAGEYWTRAAEALERAGPATRDRG